MVRSGEKSICTGENWREAGIAGIGSAGGGGLGVGVGGGVN